ncbi:glycosyltransferase family 1 protein [Butyrivibrio fibrisolvens]|uniref:glycosyltransferase family 1 protein n=1 Tax=Pseudobutyrivibrio ruminis TaxID=46206 RepID=UPI000427603C|nr:glycosyltransferase family 1 protein [Pseudobutyrivibrio ruminis]MDC7280523.1 glycosyltransferase family 1 protein [Butyrivibrio fibrisolvens]
MGRNLVLADCVKEELNEFINAIRSEGVDIECYSVISNGGRTSRFSNLGRYFKYFSVPFTIFRHRKEYDYLVGWQQFYALNFCFWCALFHVKKVNKVFAVNFTYKKKSGFVGKIYKWYMKKCICTEYIDYLHVPSPNYAKITSEEFNIPIEKFVVAPFGIDDKMDQYGNLEFPNRAPSDKYVLSIGRSNRDYDFLVDVWREIETDLVIISDEYKRQDLPKNVTLINDVSGEEQYPWISNCAALIIPIDDVTICSGDTVLLTAMSLAKTIFVTHPSTLSEMYVTDKVDAILINKDVEQTRHIINEHLQGDTQNSIGKSARETFIDKFSRYAMGKNVAAYLK